MNQLGALMLAAIGIAETRFMPPMPSTAAPPGQKGEKLRRQALRNWYSPYFYDIREAARKESK